MNDKQLIQRTEAYVREVMSKQTLSMAIAHDFKHVDRVRNWSLVFARGEGYADLTVVEITALLHDIGLGHISGPEAQQDHVVLPPHGPLGAEMAVRFLSSDSHFNRETIDLIADAIRHHSDAPWAAAEYVKGLRDGGPLLKILRDADMIDAMGAVGLMRAMTSKAFLPEYDPDDVKGPAWGLSTPEFRARFAVESGGKGTSVQTIIDQINQQIRYHDGLHTETARRRAAPFIEYMRAFIIQLEREIAMPKRIFGRDTRYQGAIVRDDQILLIRHQENETGRSYWIFPGGGIEPGETEEECVRREIREETNLDVRIVSLLMDEPEPTQSTYLSHKTYLCAPNAGEASPGIEPEPDAASWYSIAEVKWFDLRDESTWGREVVTDTLTYGQLQRIRKKMGYLR